MQFLKVLDRNNIRIEIWERGAGYTLASGSSSSAAAAVAHRLGLCDRAITVHMPGGELANHHRRRLRRRHDRAGGAGGRGDDRSGGLRGHPVASGDPELAMAGSTRTTTSSAAGYLFPEIARRAEGLRREAPRGGAAPPGHRRHHPAAHPRGRGRAPRRRREAGRAGDVHRATATTRARSGCARRWPTSTGSAASPWSCAEIFVSDGAKSRLASTSSRSSPPTRWWPSRTRPTRSTSTRT